MTSPSAPSSFSVPELVLECCNSTPDIGAVCVLDTEDHLPSIPGDPHAALSLVHLFLTSCILNAKSGSSVQVRVRNLPSAVDLSCSFVANPFFALLLRNSHEASLNAMNNKTISTASDAVVTLFLMRKRAMQRKMTTWIETDRSAETTIHLFLPHIPLRSDPIVGRPRVLIIEDNKQIGMLMELYLRQEEYDTEYAENGVIGLELARAIHPDVVTLDVMMPQKDGWQVLQELKINPVTASIPVVMVSVIKEIQSGFEWGASDYIIKPVERTALLHSVRRVLDRPVLPLPVDLVGAHSLCVVSSTNTLQKHLSAVFPQKSITTLHPGDGKLYHAALNLPCLPDLVLVDSRDLERSLLNDLMRIRLSEAFDSAPLVALASSEDHGRLRYVTPMLFDALVTMEELPPITP